jgi:two-component system, OmpR family, phosphate regulon sensor histidine kinase PhoR
LNKEKLNLITLIKSVIDEFRFVISEKGGEIYFKDPPQPLFITASELHLMHAVQNIIDNAVKYNNNRPIVSVSVYKEGMFAVVVVEDNGIGMHKEEIKYIFDKFYRVPTGNIHHTRGFGLGLNYVQSIVKAHDGRVKVKSAPWNGTRFELYIPIDIND